MNLVERISFILLFVCSCGDTGDIPTNGTLYTSSSPCSAGKNSLSVLQEQFNGYCYWNSNNSYNSFGISNLRCLDTGGILTSIHSIEELNFLRRLVQGKGDLFWIGLSQTNRGTYEWKDGTPVDFVNWENGYSGDRSNPLATCVALSPTNGYFIPTDCIRSLLYICKSRDELDDQITITTAPSNTTVAFHEVCPDGWMTFADKCYKEFGLEPQEKETWSGANQKCLDMGATLASIHSRDEQDFLYLSITEETDRSWIGFYEVPSNNDRAFHWSDSSPVDFVYWDENQPNNWNNYKEECGDMRFGYPHFGRWNDADCNLTESYFCQIHIANLCRSGTCNNAGSCTQDGPNGSFRCTCQHGYKGLTCEEKIMCEANTCQNGGYCTQDGPNDTLRCSCRHGYKGLACEEKIMCETDTCQNEGSCTQDGPNDTLRCSCPHGYKGLTCEEKMMCEADSCQNAGSCTQDGRNGTLRCSCLHGYKGLTCEETILCGTDTCRNGGSCTQDGPSGTFRCRCEHGYKGLTCEESDLSYEIQHANVKSYRIKGNVTLHFDVDVEIP